MRKKIKNIKLSQKQRLFVDEYMKEMNGTKAYLSVYKGTKKDEIAAACASKLLRNAKVKAEIESRNTKLTDKAELTADSIINEVKALAFSRMDQYVDVTDNEVTLKDWSGLTSEQLAAVQEIQVQDEKVTGTEKRVRSKVIKFKLYDKRSNLELLARRFNLFPNKIQLTDPSDKPIEIKEIIVKRPEPDATD